MIRLTLPFPPSVNRYWRHPTKGKLAGRHLISAEGRAYRDTVAREVLVQRIGTQLGRLALQVDVFPPDAQRRDLDNLFKSLLDALQHAAIVDDDNQFDALTIRRQQQVKGGLVQLQIDACATEGLTRPAIVSRNIRGHDVYQCLPMTATAPDRSPWELAGCILGDGKDLPEQRLENQRMAHAQWAQFAKDNQWLDENSGHVEITSQEGNP